MITTVIKIIILMYQLFCHFYDIYRAELHSSTDELIHCTVCHTKHYLVLEMLVTQDPYNILPVLKMHE